jgi:hypothetical protein
MAPKGAIGKKKKSAYMTFCAEKRAEWKVTPARKPLRDPRALRAQRAHVYAPHSATCIVLQAAGKKYTVPEQGKMLGAEWKGLSDKAKEKYA